MICSRNPWGLKVNQGDSNLLSSCTIGINARPIHSKPGQCRSRTAWEVSRSYAGYFER